MSVSTSPLANRKREAALLCRCSDGDFEARDELAERLMPLARSLAARYSRSSEPREDLDQVAFVGLLKALDRYDPERGPFAAFAVPSILGELKRHFRDHGWAMHVPRPVQTRYLELSRVSDEIQSVTGRAPTPRQLAARLELSIEDVVEALDAGSSYSLLALDAPHGAAGDSSTTLGDTIGYEDERYDLLVEGTAIAAVVRALPSREREILRLRFAEDLKQHEIGKRIGISQMHVSRLLRRALEKLQATVVA